MEIYVHEIILLVNVNESDSKSKFVYLGGLPVSEATATRRARLPLKDPACLKINSPLSRISNDLQY